MGENKMVNFLSLIKTIPGTVKAGIDKIGDSTKFVENVRDLTDDDYKNAALEIIKASESMTDQEKLDEIKSLQLFVEERKHVAADEIKDHQVLTAKIIIAVLSAGFSIPVETLVKALKKGKTELIEEIGEE